MSSFAQALILLAERVGFEPTVPRGTLDFELRTTFPNTYYYVTTNTFKCRFYSHSAMTRLYFYRFYTFKYQLVPPSFLSFFYHFWHRGTTTFTHASLHHTLFQAHQLKEKNAEYVPRHG